MNTEWVEIPLELGEIMAHQIHEKNLNPVKHTLH